jgi:hypothetical protein
MRLREVEERFKVVQTYHQKAWYETSMTEINNKAVAFNERGVMKRGLYALRRSALVQRRSNAFIKFKELRRNRFLKLLTFLYLKQECVLSKHIKQL